MKKSFIQIALLSLLLITISTVTVVAKPQTNNKKQSKIAFPIIPIIAEFEYSPYYMSQMLKEHPKYSMIEATFNEEDASSIEIILTEKESSNRVYYSASAEKVKQRQLSDTEAILTNINFQIPEKDAATVYGIGFSDKYKEPIVWRVIPTGKVSEYGRGVRNIPWKTSLFLEYVDLGTTIGEGTALRIGEKVIQAEPWAEISYPPYFYAYRGAYSYGRYMSVLREGRETWKTISAPTELKEGSTWKTTDQNGNLKTLKVDSQKGDVFTVIEVPTIKGNDPMESMKLINSSGGLTMRSLQIKDDSETMRITFKPELPLQPEKLVGYQAKFVIDKGGKTTISKGKITGEAISDKEIKLLWQPKSPKFAKSKVMEAVINFDGNGYSIETRATK